MRVFRTTLLAISPSILRSRAAVELDNLALRHQISVLQRSAAKRPKLTSGDRLLWICLSHLWRDWRSALAIRQTRNGPGLASGRFRPFWTWKVRRGQPGRPVISGEARDLIRNTCGARRIHGELLKLGMSEISYRSQVATDMVDGRRRS